MNNPEDIITKMVIDISSAEITLLSKGVVMISKNMLAMLVALAKEAQRTKGRIGINHLENKTSRLTTLQIPPEKLSLFQKEAKNFNVLYSMIRPSSIDILNGRANKGDMIDIIVGEKDAGKMDRILQKIKMKDAILNPLIKMDIDQTDGTNPVAKIEHKDKEGHNVINQIPLSEFAREDINKKLEPLMDNTIYIDELGNKTDINQANITGTLDNFFIKEERINERMRERFPEYSPLEENRHAENVAIFNNYYKNNKEQEILERDVDSFKPKTEQVETTPIQTTDERFVEDPETTQAINQVREVINLSRAEQEYISRLDPNDPIRQGIEETNKQKLESLISDKFKEDKNINQSNVSVISEKEEINKSVMDKLHEIKEEGKRLDSLGKLGKEEKNLIKSSGKEINR